ncbi:MAG TPA: NAD(+) diphosphatase [Polyangiales bacterium]|nr:NAD(+) diphosphatase [Polyangiales bacterium]
MWSERPHLSRAAERRADIDYLEGLLAQPSTRLVPLWREQALMHDAGGLALPSLEHAKDLLERSAELVFLGLIDDQAYFAADISELGTPLDHPAFTGARLAGDARSILSQVSDREAELALYARAILLWHARHRHCSVCGRATRPKDGGHSRLCPAPECKAQHFPRTDPCVLVLVHDGEQCLLGRQASWPKGMYSALAGFVEPCEDLETAAAREVLEESGVEIGELHYFASQPWPFPASLMIGFEAKPKTRDIHLNDAELEDARWFTRAELRAAAVVPRAEAPFFVPPLHSLAGRMLARFIASEGGARF